MFFVFAGFVLSADRALQLFGLGLAVAVFVDATIVRMVLVPATMELLGDRNWWLPAWLERVLPRFSIERTVAAERVGPKVATRPIVYWLDRASGAVNDHIDEVFETNGLSRLQWQILTLVERSGMVTRRTVQSELGAFAQDRQELASALDDLALGGWITRSRNGYALTSDGEIMRLDVRRAVAGVRTQALAGIRAKEFSATIATLERVVDNLSNGDGTGPQPSRW
jgi:hypothetical protein